jgi:antitoxin HicB
MLRYPVRFTRDDNGTLLVTAPDLPEVSTFGKDPADALFHAADAIATALQGRITARKKIPPPARRGQRLVALPAIVAAKLELHRAMMETNTARQIWLGSSVFTRRKWIACSISTTNHSWIR